VKLFAGSSVVARFEAYFAAGTADTRRLAHDLLSSVMSASGLCADVAPGLSAPLPPVK
jgi:hypothetical protein